MQKVKIAIIFISILLTLLGCGNMKDKKEVKIKNAEGELTNYVTEMKNFPQKISPITDMEKQNIEDYSNKCISFAKDYIAIEDELSLKDLDMAFILWQTKDKKKYSNENVQKMIGSYLGNYFVKNENMEWVFVEDEFGKDFAVQSKVYKVMNFPFSTVQKRIEDNESDFINNVYLSVVYLLNGDRSKRR